MTAPSPVVHLVDDDASFVVALSRLLRASGLHVKTFTSAAAFLEHLPSVTAGCVVVDLHMPAMSGLELQAALARVDAPSPVVFLTGDGDIPASVRAMRGGAEDFLTKDAPKGLRAWPTSCGRPAPRRPPDPTRPWSAPGRRARVRGPCGGAAPP